MSEVVKISIELLEENINNFFLNENWDSNSNESEISKIFKLSSFNFTGRKGQNDLFIRKILHFSKVYVAGKEDDFDNFKIKLKSYDFSTICGYTWVDSGFAYRCRTCCLTLDAVYCVTCFNNGNHDGHDILKIKCSMGALCDCGNPDAMKDSGYCCNHGPNQLIQRPEPPENITRRLKLLIPIYLKSVIFEFWSLIQSFDQNNYLPEVDYYSVQNILSILSFINELLSCGWLPQTLVAEAMVDKTLFKDFLDDFRGSEQFFVYEREILSKLDFKFPKKIGSQQLHHETLLDVFFLICVKFRFHENIVSLLNGLLRIDSYKEAFIDSYLNHYAISASTLLKQSRNTISEISQTMANGLSIMSVQLFCFEVNLLKVTKKKNFHYLVVHCLLNMLRKFLVRLDVYGNCVINCRNVLMQYCRVWPFIFDFTYLYFHKPVLEVFIWDQEFMDDWIKLLKWMQFMNIFIQKNGVYEKNFTMFAIGTEIDISTSSMWNIWSQYRSKGDKERVLEIVNHFVGSLAKFIDSLGRIETVQERKPLSFHLPLMRNVTCFLSLALFHHHLTLDTLLKSINMKQIIRWFSETANTLLGCHEVTVGYWPNNGPNLTITAFEYIHNKFSFGLIDMDILAFQICASVIPSSTVIHILTDPTQLLRGITFTHQSNSEENESASGFKKFKRKALALEAWFTTISWLLDLRLQMNIDDITNFRREVCCRLCINSLKRSDLEDGLKRRTNLDIIQSSDLDCILSEIAIYVAPTFDDYSNNLQNGFYTFKSDLWSTEYDPVFQSLRSSKEESTKAQSKYRDYYRRQKNVTYADKLWPPFRIPKPVTELPNLENILHNRDLTYIIFNSLNMFLNDNHLVTEDSLAIIVHIIHRSILIDEPSDDDQPLLQKKHSRLSKFTSYFGTVFSNSSFGKQTDNNKESYNTRFPMNPYQVNNSRLNIRVNVNISSEVKKSNDYTMFDGFWSTPMDFQQESILSLLLKIHSKLHMIHNRSGSKSLFLKKIFITDNMSSGNSSGTDDDLHTNGEESLITIIARQKYYLMMTLGFYKSYPLIYQYSKTNLKKAKESGVGINWGDGVDFIGHLLDVIASRNDDNSKYLFKLIDNIIPMNVSDEVNSDCDSTNQGYQSNTDSDSDAKQKINQRRQKMLYNMVSKQKKFVTNYQLDKSAESEHIDNTDYECVICQLKGDEVTNGNYMVLSGLVASGYLLLYMQDMPGSRDHGTARIYRKHYRERFVDTNPILSQCIVIQTCGHMIHRGCFESYIAYKRYMPFACPMCRREVHYLLPINTADILVTSEDSFYSNLESRLLKSFVTPPGDIQSYFIGISFVNRIIANIDYEHQSCSLLRSQLELELIVCLSAPDQYSTVTKRCHWPQFISYLRTLNTNITTLIRQSDWLLGTSIYGKIKKDQYENGSSQRRPFLLEIPSDVLLNFIPYVWPYEDQVRYILDACIIMAYIKGMVMVASKLDRSQYDHWSTERPYADEIEKQFIQISMRLKTLGYIPSLVDPTKDLRPQYILTNNTMINELVKCLLPVLRLAAVLKLRHLKAKDIPKNFPSINTIDNETLNCMEHFIQLCEYLNLTKSKYSPHECSTLLESLISNCLKSILYGTFIETVNVYVNEEFIDVLMKEQKELREPILNVLNIGNELCLPRLIPLPKSYEDLFIAHQTKKCVTSKLDHDRQRNGLCLICGELLCLLCPSIPMAIFKHSVACCLGLGVIIDVNSSIVYVLVNDEVAQWGSVYLDYYGEEDLELKRGRPLFVNGPRLKLLEQQWMTLSFKHVLKMWTRI